MTESPADHSSEPSGESAAESPDETLSYEAARDELVEVVHKLEAGGVTLEESIALWERGEQLARICQRWLDGARSRLDEVVRSAGARPGNAARSPPGDAGRADGPAPSTTPTQDADGG
jgi:exodeoxyribonuclease VII small subunit